MSAGPPPLADTAERVRLEIERTIQRNIKGLEFLTAPKQSVGAMDKELLLRRGTLAFYRYRAVAAELYRVPILIVSPTSNRGYVFDLAKGQSLVEFLLTQGYDVFLMDWLPPRRDESRLRLEDYVQDMIPACAAIVRDLTGIADVTLMGYCMGGTLALIHAAFAQPGTVANLVLLATPVDFEPMTLFRAWVDPAHFDLDRLVDTVGNVPGEMVLGAFDLLRPANRPAGRLHLWANMWDDEFVRSYRMFERWSAETLPIAGEYFRQTTKAFLWENALCRNELAVGGRHVDLGAITAPILNIIAEHDHVVPHACAQPLGKLVGSTDYEEITVKGGHVSVVAGPAAAKRLWPSIDAWLGRRSV